MRIDGRPRAWNTQFCWDDRVAVPWIPRSLRDIASPMMAPTALLLSLLAGCFSEADFAESYWRAECEQILACYEDGAAELLQYDDVESCLEYHSASISDTRASVGAEDCTYDAQQAQTCIEELTDASCEDYLGGAFQETCDAVCAE